jgi:hypothetical protein
LLSSGWYFGEALLGRSEPFQSQAEVNAEVAIEFDS